MTAKPSLSWVIWFTLAVAGCATPLHQRLESVADGMDKTQVLDTAGTPKRTHRLNSGDVWTYVYYVGNRHFERDVRFESGHVVMISTAREIPPEGANGDQIIKDYEKLVNEAKSNSTSKDAKARE